MTTVADETTADEETEAVEEDEQTSEPEPELEPETPSAQTDIDIEKAAGRLSNENQRHAKRVAEIMGPDFSGLFECPACSGFAAGFVWELPSAGPTYQPARFTEMCPECSGMGDVATGAVVRNLLVPCERCAGLGYIRLAGSPSPITHPTYVPPQPVAIENGQRSAPRAETDDAWGRPAGHPHWGLPPESIGV